MSFGQLEKWELEYLEGFAKSRTLDENMKHNDETADQYDKVSRKKRSHFVRLKQFYESAGWKGPRNLADAFFTLDLPKSARILDLGSGTGMLGKILHEKGYVNIDAMDASSNMLEKCKSLGNVYSAFFEHLVIPDRPYPPECADYDVVLLSGVVFPGVFSFKELRRLTEITKRGGILGFNVVLDPLKDGNTDFTQDGVHRNTQELVDEGILEPIPDNYPKTCENVCWDSLGEVYLGRVLK